MSLVKLVPYLFLSSLFSTHSHLDICGRHRSNAALCTCSKHINIPRILVYTPSALQHTSSMSNMISEVPTPLVVTSVPGPASIGGWLSNCACLCVCAGFCKAQGVTNTPRSLNQLNQVCARLAKYESGPSGCERKARIAWWSWSFHGWCHSLEPLATRWLYRESERWRTKWSDIVYCAILRSRPSTQAAWHAGQ